MKYSKVHRFSWKFWSRNSITGSHITNAKIPMTSQRTLNVKVFTSVRHPWPSPNLSLFPALSNPATLSSALHFSFLFLIRRRRKKKNIPLSGAVRATGTSLVSIPTLNGTSGGLRRLRLHIVVKRLGISFLIVCTDFTVSAFLAAACTSSGVAVPIAYGVFSKRKKLFGAVRATRASFVSVPTLNGTSGGLC